MVSTKVINFTIQSGSILGPDGFSKNYMGSCPEDKSVIFSLSPRGPYIFMYGLLVYVDDSFHTVRKIKIKLQSTIDSKK